MREALFIMLVALVLIGLTAFRYRKTIAGMIGFAQMLKDAKQDVLPTAGRNKAAQKSGILVNCSKCGVWVPQNKARKIGELFYCSDTCASSG